MVTPPGSAAGGGWRELMGVLVGAGVAWGGLSYVALTIGVLADGYGYTLSGAANLATAELAAMAVASLSSGLALRHVSVRSLAIAGGACAAAANVATAIAASAAAVLCCRIMAGVGLGAMTGGLNTSISRTDDPHRLFLRANFGCITAAAVFFAALPEIYGRFGFRSYFVAYGAVSGLAAFALAAIPNPLPAGGAAQDGVRGRARDYALAVAAGLLWLCYAAVWSLTERLGRDIGISEETVGRIMGLGTLSGLIGAAAATYAGRYYGPLWPLIGTSLGTGLCYVWWAYSDSAASYAWMLSIWGVVFCPMLAYLYAVGSEMDGTGHVNRWIGAALAISTALGPVLGATVYEHVGYHGVGLLALFGTVAACVGVSRCIPGGGRSLRFLG